jgi:hypothetical protein
MPDQKPAAKPKSFSRLTHGLYANEVLLPWDNRAEFIKLHEALTEEFFPNGRSEEECVLDLAYLHWQKRTLMRMRTASVCRDWFVDDIVATDKKSWEGIRQGLRAKAQQDHILAQTLEAGAATAAAHLSRKAVKYAKELNQAEAEKLLPRLNAALDMISNKMLPLAEKARQLPDAEGAFEKHYLPEDFEKITRIETAMDVRISKVLGRLVSLKEFKRTPAGSPLARVMARSDGPSGKAGV